MNDTKLAIDNTLIDELIFHYNVLDSFEYKGY